MIPIYTYEKKNYFFDWGDSPKWLTIQQRRSMQASWLNCDFLRISGVLLYTIFHFVNLNKSGINCKSSVQIFICYLLSVINCLLKSTQMQRFFFFFFAQCHCFIPLYSFYSAVCNLSKFKTVHSIYWDMDRSVLFSHHDTDHRTSWSTKFLSPEH